MSNPVLGIFACPPPSSPAAASSSVTNDAMVTTITINIAAAPATPFSPNIVSHAEECFRAVVNVFLGGRENQGVWGMPGVDVRCDSFMEDQPRRDHETWHHVENVLGGRDGWGMWKLTRGERWSVLG